jgi:hypothetical protein
MLNCEELLFLVPGKRGTYHPLGSFIARRTRSVGNSARRAHKLTLARVCLTTNKSTAWDVAARYSRSMTSPLDRPRRLAETTIGLAADAVKAASNTSNGDVPKQSNLRI